MIVVDASVLVKVLTGEPGAETALARLAEDADRIAPDWLRLEIANALAKKVVLGEMGREAANDAIAVAADFLTEMPATLGLLDRGYELALELQHAVYDCLYLALVTDRDATLVTCDAKFAAAARAAGYADRIELIA